MLKVFVDDRRACPQAGFNCFKSYEETIRFFTMFKSIEMISLDYDLNQAKNGLDILKYMYDHQIKVQHINIHTTHLIGLQRMQTYVVEHFEGVKLTFHKYL